MKILGVLILVVFVLLILIPLAAASLIVCKTRGEP